MPSLDRSRFHPFSLDALNFLLADVCGGLGPYLNVSIPSGAIDYGRRAAAPSSGVQERARPG